MKNASALSFAALVLLILALCWNLASQTFTPQPFRKVPTNTAEHLLHEDIDFRTEFFDSQAIEAMTRRGVVCLIKGEFLVTGRVEERSTNDWLRVSNVLHSARMLVRHGNKPQIRVVQRDLILQSRIGFPSISESGFSSSFLERQLEPGDIVIITLLND